jgi:hypothetical protein
LLLLERRATAGDPGMGFAAALRQSATPARPALRQQGFEGAHIRLRCPAFDRRPSMRRCRRVAGWRLSSMT